MKFLVYLILFFCAFYVQGQDLSDGQKTLITKRTATWCPNCGSWGWEYAKAIENIGNGNAILIRAHYSGNLMSKAGVELTENFDPIYQPEFYINEVRQSVGSTSWSSKIEEMESAIESNAQKSANVSIELAGTYTNNSFNTDVKIRSLSPMEGEYYVALYILEDNIEENQSGYNGMAIHNNVLRWSMTEETFGEMIFSESVESGIEASKSYSVSLESEDLSGRMFDLLAVVWKKEGEKFLVENLHQVSLNQSSSVLSSEASYEHVVYSRERGELIANLNLKKPYPSAQVSIIALNGAILEEFQANLDAGSNEIIKRINNPIPQIVLFTVTGEGSLLMSEKVMLK